MIRSSVLGLGLAVVALAQAWAGCRLPQDLPVPAGNQQASPGQFLYRPGVGLGCVIDADAGQAMADQQRPVTFLSCLHLGRVAVAQRRAQVEAVLGAAQATRPMDDRTQVSIYDIAQRGRPLPRYLITYRDDVAVAVQLAGPPTDMPLTFSGLGLGASVQQVVDVLGPPTRLCDQPHVGAQLWLWEPFPIAVDIADGHVLAFRLTVPAVRRE